MPQAQELVVLADDLGGSAREVEGDAALQRTQVIAVEYEVLRQRLGIAPNGPAQPRVHQAVLVTGNVDGGQVGQAEVKHDLWEHKWGHERPRGAIHMNHNVPPILGIQLTHCSIDAGDVLELPGVRAAKDCHHANRVLITLRRQQLRSRNVASFFRRNVARFDVPVATELQKRPILGCDKLASGSKLYVVV